MNSFESDLKRAILSKAFLIGFILKLLILFNGGFDSTIFKISLPLVCTLPFSCGFLDEYKNGFIKFSVCRSTYTQYISGKFLAAGLSAGLLEMCSGWIYVTIKNDPTLSCNYQLLFLCAMLWASVAVLFAAISRSKYLAYGGSFVVCYFLVILYERYWKSLYCLYPYEWYQPTHTWVFGDTGVVIMLVTFIIILFLLYFKTLRRLIQNV